MRPSRFQRHQILVAVFGYFTYSGKSFRFFSVRPPASPRSGIDGRPGSGSFTNFAIGTGSLLVQNIDCVDQVSDNIRPVRNTAIGVVGDAEVGGMPAVSHQDATDALTILKETMYRVHTSSLTILNLDGERIPVTIPANSCIQIDVLSASHARLLFIPNSETDRKLETEKRGLLTCRGLRLS